MATTSSSATSSPPPPMSAVARIFGVFTAPARTFADIARDPHFVLCWCVQIVVGFAYAVLMLHRVGVYNLARETLMQNPRTSALAPAALQAAIATTAKVMGVTFYLTPVIAILLLLLMGWIFQGIANFLLGLEAGFKQALAMVSHAYLTQTLLALLTMLVLGLMPDPTQFQLTNPIGTNLGFFLDKTSTSAFLYAFSIHLDLFTLWTVVLLALGLAKLGGRKGKFSSAFWAVFGLWLLFAIIAAGTTAAFA